MKHHGAQLVTCLHKKPAYGSVPLELDETRPIVEEMLFQGTISSA